MSVLGTAAPHNGHDVGGQPENQRAANLRALVLALATFAVSTGTFIVTGILPGVANDLSVSVATAGHLVTLFAVVFALSSPVLVALTGRVPRRRLLVITLALFAHALLAALRSAGLDVRGRTEKRGAKRSASLSEFRRKRGLSCS